MAARPGLPAMSAWGTGPEACDDPERGCAPRSLLPTRPGAGTPSRVRVPCRCLRGGDPGVAGTGPARRRGRPRARVRERAAHPVPGGRRPSGRRHRRLAGHGRTGPGVRRRRRGRSCAGPAGGSASGGRRHRVGRSCRELSHRRGGDRTGAGRHRRCRGARRVVRHRPLRPRIRRCPPRRPELRPSGTGLGHRHRVLQPLARPVRPGDHHLPPQRRRLVAS